MVLMQCQVVVVKSNKTNAQSRFSDNLISDKHHNKLDRMFKRQNHHFNVCKSDFFFCYEE